ncbi:MAG: F0F1 ATP synthase subunit A [Acidobacteria bacterium]|nr:F0F1 ATP synthase subunit A [Acidobacteriota bacterium]
MGEWFTSLLNTLFARPVVALEGLVGIHPENPLHPIPEYVAMQIIVVAIIMVLLWAVRRRLSMDKPGKLQQVMELLVDGLGSQAEEIIGHGSKKFLPLLLTLGLFIFLSNILGMIPSLSTPTAEISVTLGCAVAAFAYYNYWGLHHHGLFGYLRTFMGPVLAIGPLMFLIEIVSHLARVLSLSVRLMANMLAGQNISLIFMGLVPLAVPVVFEGLHIFVALLQAYIFVLLTMVYLAGAVAEEH